MVRVRLSLFLCLSILVAANEAAPQTAPSPARNRRIAAPDGGAIGAEVVSISDDARFLAFVSWTPNLVPDDDDQQSDVFVYDRVARRFERVNGAVSPVPGNGYFSAAVISGNGQVVAFVVTEMDDGGFHSSVYIHDRETRRTLRVAEGEAPSISADGRYVAFASHDATIVSDTNSTMDVFVFDRLTGKVARASETRTGAEGNGASFAPVLSANGRKLLFASYATNLVAGDTNDAADLFLQDRQTGAITRVSVGVAGQANGETTRGRLSSDGQIVVFESYASNLVSGDTNNSADVFVRDLTTRTTTRVSVDSFGRQADNGSVGAQTNASGRYVVFQSYASNLVRDVPVPWQPAVLLHDRKTGITQRIDRDAHGNPASDVVGGVAFSANGRFLAMTTGVALVDDDVNRLSDAYLRDLGTLPLAASFEALDLSLQSVSAAGQLQSTVASARAASDTGDRAAACKALNAAERAVQAQWGRDIPGSQAGEVFVAVGAVGAQLGCLDGPPSVFRFSKWTIPVAVDGYSDRRNIHAGDFDGDGRVDSVFDFGSGLTVIAGDGLGGVREQVATGITGILLAASDLNADGRTDLVIGDEYESRLRILLSARTGPIAFTETRIPLDAPPTSVAVGDLTGDARVDIVVGNDRLPAAMLIAGGRSGFKKPQAIDTGYVPTRVALADVSGDGRLDLVYAWYSDLFVARGAAGLPEPWQYLGPGFSGFRLADVDGDGTSELIAWQTARLDVYRVETYGLVRLSSMIGRPIWNVAVADFNHDHRPDLVTVESDRSLAIFQGNGDGTFGMRETVPTRPGLSTVDLADMNGDGQTDIVAATYSLTSWGSVAMTILLNDPAVFINTPNDETSVAIGTTLTIKWDHAQPAGTPFRIEVSRDGGGTWSSIASRVVPAGPGKYGWIVSGPPTRRARLRVTSLGSPSASDVNNSTFSIGAPTMKLESPQPGANWGIGTDRRITWAHNLGPGEKVHVDLSRDDGRTWTRLATDFPLNGGTSARFATIATGPETATARVRLVWARDPSLTVVSGAFRIAAPFLRLIEPATGANYPMCTGMTVTFRHNLGIFERMNAEVSYDGGVKWWPIAMDFPNQGDNKTTAWTYVTTPETTTGVVRVTWRKDPSLTATASSLILGRNEGFVCDDNQ